MSLENAFLNRNRKRSDMILDRQKTKQLARESGGKAKVYWSSRYENWVVKMNGGTVCEFERYKPFVAQHAIESIRKVKSGCYRETWKEVEKENEKTVEKSREKRREIQEHMARDIEKYVPGYHALTDREGNIAARFNGRGRVSVNVEKK